MYYSKLFVGCNEPLILGHPYLQFLATVHVRVWSPLICVKFIHDKFKIEYDQECLNGIRWEWNYISIIYQRWNNSQGFVY